MTVRNTEESNFQSFTVRFFPHSSHSLPFQSTSKHSNQTVHLCTSARHRHAGWLLSTSRSGSLYQQLLKLSEDKKSSYITYFADHWISKVTLHIYGSPNLGYHDVHVLLWSEAQECLCLWDELSFPHFSLEHELNWYPWHSGSWKSPQFSYWTEGNYVWTSSNTGGGSGCWEGAVVSLAPKHFPASLNSSWLLQEETLEAFTT